MRKMTLCVLEEIVRHNPELRTRPILVQEIQRNPHLHRVLVRMIHEYCAIAVIGDPAIATNVLEHSHAHYWKYLIQEFGDLDRGKSDHAAWNELVGFYRNLRLNMLLRIRPNKWLLKHYKEYDVIRVRALRKWLMPDYGDDTDA